MPVVATDCAGVDQCEVYADWLPVQLHRSEKLGSVSFLEILLRRYLREISTLIAKNAKTSAVTDELVICKNQRRRERLYVLRHRCAPFAFRHYCSLAQGCYPDRVADFRQQLIQRGVGLR